MGYSVVGARPDQQAFLPRVVVKGELEAIRAIDSHHTVIVDTAGWANIDYLKDLKDLTIPDWEKNAIVSFHYYSPIFLALL